MSERKLVTYSQEQRAIEVKVKRLPKSYFRFFPCPSIDCPFTTEMSSNSQDVFVNRIKSGQLPPGSGGENANRYRTD